MKSPTHLHRNWLAALMKLCRRSHLADLNLTLAGFGVPVCPGLLMIQDFRTQELADKAVARAAGAERKKSPKGDEGYS